MAGSPQLSPVAAHAKVSPRRATRLVVPMSVALGALMIGACGRAQTAENPLSDSPAGSSVSGVAAISGQEASAQQTVRELDALRASKERSDQVMADWKPKVEAYLKDCDKSHVWNKDNPSEAAAAQSCQQRLAAMNPSYTKDKAEMQQINAKLAALGIDEAHLDSWQMLLAQRREAALAPVNPKAPTIPTTCPLGSSVVGSACMRDTFMRPDPSIQESVRTLRHSAQAELDEVRFHGFLVSWDGIWTILSRAQVAEASSTAEDESNEMRAHLKAYYAIEEQIEALTGDKAAAERQRVEREAHIYVRRDGDYAVHPSEPTALSQNYLPDDAPPLKAVEPVSGQPYTPGDVAVPPPLKDNRPIPPNGYKSEE